MSARGTLAVSIAAAGMMAGVVGCGDPAARVTLAPVDHGTCGRPSTPTAIRVTAYARSGEVTRSLGPTETVDIADFPADTEQLGVEVVAGGGAVGAAGKTAPLDFADLPDGAQVPIFMAPPNGFCPTATPMTQARVAPLLARAGDRVLVIGGHDGRGGWLSTAELYDPATGTFTPVEVPDVLGENGFAGTAVASLPDGTIAVSGGPQPVITLFGQVQDKDPDDLAFQESVLIEARAFHTSIATDATHVLVAGGCSDVAGGACSGVNRKSTKLYDLSDLGSFEPRTTLEAGRTGATIFDVGFRADGKRTYVIAGGTPSTAAPTAADVFAITDDRSVAVTGTYAQVATLDGGGVLTAFALDADPASKKASVIVPDADAARPLADGPELTGVRLIGLEDGRVVGIGGARSPEIASYDPTLDRWQLATPQGPAPGADAMGAPTGAIHAPAMIGLADGSVLVLGGHDDAGLPSRDAWIFRPSLIGPASGSVTVVPSGGTTTVLTPTDPATVTRIPEWQLTATGELARALVGGPRMVVGSVQATVHVRDGGVALVARHLGPGQELTGELVPGTPARLVQRTGGSAVTVCTGKPVPALDPAIAATVRLEVTTSRARLLLDGIELLACAGGSGERGAWGVAALGVGARVTVDTVTVAR